MLNDLALKSNKGEIVGRGDNRKTKKMRRLNSQRRLKARIKKKIDAGKTPKK